MSQRDPDRPSHRAALPPVERRAPGALFTRALRRRCPHCGGGGIFKHWLSLHERCPTCGFIYEREEGYFLGAYALNLVVAELIGFAIVIALLVWTGISILQLQIIAVVLAVGLPLLFFPFSRTLWMAVDLLLPPPREVTTPNRREW